MSHIKLPKYLGSCKMHCCVLALSWSHYAYFPSLTIDIALVASHYTSETVFKIKWSMTKNISILVRNF